MKYVLVGIACLGLAVRSEAAALAASNDAIAPPPRVASVEKLGAVQCVAQNVTIPTPTGSCAARSNYCFGTTGSGHNIRGYASYELCDADVSESTYCTKVHVAPDGPFDREKDLIAPTTREFLANSKKCAGSKIL